IAGDETKNNLWLMNSRDEIKMIEVKNFSWDDLEGLAPFEGNAFLGMTSHSLTRSGKRKPERENLILFQLKENEVKMMKHWSLRDQLMDFIEKKVGSNVDVYRMRNSPPDQGGLNIEGLGYLDGKIYLGVRSPLTKNGNALIVTVGSPLSNLQLLEVTPVNLDGKGIRGIDQDEQGLLILSGPVDDLPATFGLHRYDPRSIRTQVLHYAGFENVMRPESLLKDNDGSLLLFQDFKVPQNQDVIMRLRPSARAR
ncbi:MAG: DUF3616 domain-containing protein, partial [Bacteriovoracaceae bacterium]